jgi:hypothetical protein
MEEQVTRRPGVINTLIADGFLNAIPRRSTGPTFLFLHTLLEHFPHLSLPTGQFNITRAEVPGLASVEHWGEDDWAIAQLYQRHLLQLGYVDGFLGRLVSRLKAAGLYGRALVIVTSDHGASFQARSWRRRYSDETAAEIMRVPLIIKLPDGTPWPDGSSVLLGGQRISDRNVETIDIAPTVAQVVGVPLPWHADGVSVLDQSQPERSSKTVFFEDARHSRRFDRNGPDLSPVMKRKTNFFDGPLHTHFAPRPKRFAELFGQPLSGLRIEDGERRVQVDHLSRFLDFQHRPDSFPFDVAGRLDRGRPGNDPTYLAVAVNGVIWAVTQTWKSDPLGWQATPPPFVWRDGANDLGIFILEEDDNGPLLRRTDLHGES